MLRSLFLLTETGKEIGKGIAQQNFLQGILSQDMKKVGESHLTYSLMLNAKGRYLYDVFIFICPDGWVLDLPLSFDPKDLMRYRLRHNVELIPLSIDVRVSLTVSGKWCFLDPRHPSLGFRIYSDEFESEKSLLMQGEGKQKNGECMDSAQDFEQESNDREKVFNDEAWYHHQRLKLLIPDDTDMVYEKTIPLEMRMDELGAISFDKGCYIGQEFTTMTKHRNMNLRTLTVQNGVFSLSEKS